ncbi:MAG: cellulose synthase operon protein YhjQ/BcsQ [Pirellulaceae bacterium]
MGLTLQALRKLEESKKTNASRADLDAATVARPLAPSTNADRSETEESPGRSCPDEDEPVEDYNIPATDEQTTHLDSTSEPTFAASESKMPEVRSLENHPAETDESPTFQDNDLEPSEPFYNPVLRPYTFESTSDQPVRSAARPEPSPAFRSNRISMSAVQLPSAIFSDVNSYSAAPSAVVTASTSATAVATASASQETEADREVSQDRCEQPVRSESPYQPVVCKSDNPTAGRLSETAKSATIRSPEPDDDAREVDSTNEPGESEPGEPELEYVPIRPTIDQLHHADQILGMMESHAADLDDDGFEQLQDHWNRFLGIEGNSNDSNIEIHEADESVTFDESNLDAHEPTDDLPQIADSPVDPEERLSELASVAETEVAPESVSAEMLEGQPSATSATPENDPPVEEPTAPLPVAELAEPPAAEPVAENKSSLDSSTIKPVASDAPKYTETRRPPAPPANIVAPTFYERDLLERLANSACEEQLQRIANSLADAPQVVIFVSCEVTRRTSDVASQFGIYLADRGESTLLVDANADAPFLTERFCRTQQPGFGEAYQNPGDTDEWVQTTSMQNLRLLPFGQVGSHAFSTTSRIDANHIERLINFVNKRHSFTVMDAGHADSPLTQTLLPFCDAVILVVETNRTSQKAAQKAAYRIRRSGGTLQGCVVTDSQSSDS